MQTKWRASWVDRVGDIHEYVFTAPSNRAIAVIDFKLELLRLREPVPERFELKPTPTPPTSEEKKTKFRATQLIPI